MDISKILGFFFGSKQGKDLRRLQPILDQVNAEGDKIGKLSDDEHCVNVKII